MKIKETHLSVGRDGWQVVSYEENRWSVWSSRLAEGFASLIGHPCCGKGLWKYIPGSYYAAFVFINWAANFLQDKRGRRRIGSIDITREEALVLNPEFVTEYEWLMDE